MKMWFVLLFCNKIDDSVLAIFFPLNPLSTHIHKCPCLDLVLFFYKYVKNYLFLMRQ